MQVAIVYGGRVENIIEAESVEAAQGLFPDAVVVEANGFGIGWISGGGNTWLPPAAPAARILQVSPPTFLLLFTSQERIGIRAARNYVGADAGANMVKAVLDDWFAIIDDPRLQYVDLALPATQQGIDFLVTTGLLTALRAEEIKLGVAA